jgi:PAS domain S-box-containing protein
MKSIWDNLLVRFSVVSMVVLAAVAVSIVVFVSDQIKRDAIEDVIDRAAFDTHPMVLGALEPADFEGPMAGERLDEFDRWLRSTLLTGVTAMVKVWSEDGALIYSSDPTDVEPGLDHDPHLPAASMGEAYAHVLPADESSPGSPRSRELIEVYAPVVFPGATEALGVIETYQYYAPTAQRIDEMRVWVLLITGLGFVVLYGVLVTVVWEASRIISRQRSALVNANADLESRVEARTAEVTRLYREREAAVEEKAVVDEVASIVTSTLDIDQVYEKFAAEVRKLVDLDRMSVNIINPDGDTFTPVHQVGLPVEGREVDRAVPLRGSILEELMRTGQTLLRANIQADERFSGDPARIRAGMRAELGMLLYSKGRITGGLALWSRQVAAYGPREQAIMERLADQIAPAVENARLYQELQTSAEEKAVVDEVARIVTSTLDIDQVYERFASEVKKLMDFDRIVITVIDHEAGTYTPTYLYGVEVGGREAKSVVPLGGSIMEQVLRTGRAFRREDMGVGGDLLGDSARVAAGLRSNLSVPLVSKGLITGTIGVYSRHAAAYGPREQAILERLADQIAPAMENARLYESLRQSEATNRAFVRAIPDNMFRVRRDGMYLDCVAPNTEDLFDPSIDYVGRTVSEILPGELAQAIMASVERALQTGEIQRYEYQTSRQAEIRERELRIVANGPDDVLIISRNITERKRVEDALRDSEERFRRLFEESPIGVALAGEEYRVIEANNAYCQMLGYTREEMSGLNLADINHPDETEANTALFMKLFNGEIQSYQIEKRHITKDGETIWVRTTTGAIRDETGKPKYVLGVVENVTERKLLQEQLAQAQKMEVVGQLAGGVAHDFNNLLTPILGFSAMGTEELAPDHPARRYFEQVQSAAERGADLVRRLLLFSRRQIAQPRAVNLNDVVVNTEQMLDRLIGEDIELACRLEPDLGKVKADPGQMEQILVNLAVNARDAMPGGGKLTIGTANVTLDPDTDSDFSLLVPGQYVKLSVSDTGAGMDDEVRAHLFEPFFTTKEPGKGTGLGLAICFSVVKEAEGHIRVQSEPGQGTTFEILLPRVEEAATEAPKGSSSAGIPGGRETVLLVEDEPAVRSLAALALRRQGYTVLEAANGEEALRVAQEYRPDGIDLLLTDVVMPHMGGSRLAELLRPQIPRLKVMFTSGFPDDTAVPGPASSPGTAFLPKPFTPTELTRRVREVLDASGPGA